MFRQTELGHDQKRSPRRGRPRCTPHFVLLASTGAVGTSLAAFHRSPPQQKLCLQLKVQQGKKASARNVLNDPDDATQSRSPCKRPSHQHQLARVAAPRNEVPAGRDGDGDSRYRVNEESGLSSKGAQLIIYKYLH